MRIFTKTTKVIGLGREELEQLSRLINEAKSQGKAITQTSNNTYLAIEVNEVHQSRSHERVEREDR